MCEKPLIIVSAIRFFQGGAIVIVDDCLRFLDESLSHQYRIIALVYKKDLYSSLPNVEFIEFPKARKNILYRLYYEYFYFNNLSKKHKPHLWFSMQDSTPRVQTKIQALYFHNALPLLSKPLRLLRLQPRIYFLRLLYKTIYTKRLQKNNFIVVQQNSMADFLKANYQIHEPRLLIFPPKTTHYSIEERKEKIDYTFIYPANAFAYKNYEIILQACNRLKENNAAFKIIFTISDNENNYIKQLKLKYNFPQIEFRGAMMQSDLFDLYNQCDCMIFPSLTESWGLPLSEFALQNKPIICADLPYAKETLCDYNKVKFFNPYNAEELAAYMFEAIKGNLLFDKSTFKHNQPIIQNWKELFDIFLTAES